MMDDDSEDIRVPQTSKHPFRQTVSKLQDGSRHGRPSHKTKNGRHDRKTTPLVPSKGGASSREPDDESGSSRLGLDTGKLHSILRGYGEYPAKYR